MGLAPQASIDEGTGKSERIGRKIQLASIGVKGILKSGADNVFIRWMIIKSTEKMTTADWNTILQTPRILLFRADQANEPLWNARFNRRDDDVWTDTAPSGPTLTSERVWDYIKIVKHGTITMPEWKTTQQCYFGVTFPPGKRPIITFDDVSATGTDQAFPVYNLIMWCNDSTNNPGLVDAMGRIAFYDS